MPSSLFFCSSFIDLFVGGTFSGAILISYGAFWAGNGILFFPDADQGATLAYTNAEDVAQARAIYDIMWSLYTLMLTCLSMVIRSGTLNLTFNLFFVFLALMLSGSHYLVASEWVAESLTRASGKFIGWGIAHRGQ
jgi:succinate-acetate transporter protein